MKGLIFIYASLVAGSIGALVRPSYGVIAYFGFAVLVPSWIWRWSIPADPGFQKYLAAATAAGILLSGFRGNRIRGGIAWATGGLLAFLALSFASWPSSVDPAASADHMDVIWKIVAMSSVAIFVLTSPSDIRLMSWALVIGQGYNAWEINLSYLQTGWSWAAQNGWGYLDNNTYSLLTLPIAGLSAGLALYETKVWLRLLAAGIFVLQVHEIMLLVSRGAMLGCFLLLCLAIAYMPKTRTNVCTTLAALAIAAVLAGPPVVEEFSTIFASEGERDSSAASRFGLWKAGAAIVRDYPLLGCGPHAPASIVPAYYPGGLNSPKKALHNLFFDVAAGTGIPSAIAFFSFFAIPWYLAVKRWRRGDVPHWAKPALFAVLTGTPAYMLASMFSSGLRIESPYICTAVAAAALLVLRQRETEMEDNSMPELVDDADVVRVAAL